MFKLRTDKEPISVDLDIELRLLSRCSGMDVEVGISNPQVVAKFHTFNGLVDIRRSSARLRGINER